MSYTKSAVLPVSPDEAFALITEPERRRCMEGSGPFGPPERPMGGYLSLPPDLPDDEATGWLERARDHVATFPPKGRKK